MQKKEKKQNIEEKSKIDEMRRQFISDVSHALKTPIALIQGYAEGLIENVNTDEESKNSRRNRKDSRSMQKKRNRSNRKCIF